MDASSSLSISIPDFSSDGQIPAKFTCDGDATLSPEIVIAHVPEGTRSLALLMDDPDVPREVKADGVFDHWVLYNIPPTTSIILQGESAGQIGLNGSGKQAYIGPCPPKQYQPSEHRYVFSLYALDTELQFSSPPTKSEVQDAMQGHIIAQTKYVGRYQRP